MAYETRTFETKYTKLFQWQYKNGWISNPMAIGCRIAWLHEIYQSCLTLEIKKVGLVFEREMEPVIFYEGEDVGN